MGVVLTSSDSFLCKCKSDQTGNLKLDLTRFNKIAIPNNTFQMASGEESQQSITEHNLCVTK